MSLIEAMTMVAGLVYLVLLAWQARSGWQWRLASGQRPSRPARSDRAGTGAITGFARCLTFSTGYLANLAVTPTIAGRGDAVFADPVLLQFDLLVGGVVHEDQAVAVVEQIGEVLLLQRHALDLVFRPETLVQLVAGFQVLGLDVGEGAALAGLDVAGLGDDPQAAVVLQDHAGLDGVAVDFHRNRWM